jgi:hypothetical protein
MLTGGFIRQKRNSSMLFEVVIPPDCPASLMALYAIVGFFDMGPYKLC